MLSSSSSVRFHKKKDGKRSNGEVLERWRISGEVLEKLWRNDGEAVET